MEWNEARRKAASLLRLAARGGTMEEAATAAAKAQEIIDRYELKRDALEYDADPAREAEEAPIDYHAVAEGWLDSQSRLPRWRGQLALSVAALNGCYVWQSRRGRFGVAGATSLEIVGAPGSVESVRYLYAWLGGEIVRLTDKHGRGMGATWRNNFAVGAVESVVRRLREQREQTIREVRAEHAHNPAALVRVERSIARVQGQARIEARNLAHKAHKLGGGGSYRFTGDASARDAGRSAGNNISLGQTAGRLGGASKMLGGAR